MAILSPADLLDWLARNEFLTPQQTAPLRILLVSFPDSHALAKELIRRDWLTPFQVNQILQGKQDQLVVDSYRLMERIGEGAMGQVFKARQPKLDRVVAIKMILKELANSPRAMERFRREVEAASKLEHPNIGAVLDAGESEGRPYLVMDFIDGFDLSRRVKQKGELPIHEAVEYARQAALGLQHAFERGIVHRDIKPGNLLVTTVKTNEGTTPVVKILDFGLARYESEENNTSPLTEVGKLLGTIDYIAPEQAHDAHRADIRADIYSLGCTLFYLLTARPPFLGENVVEKLGPRMTGEAPWVRAERPEISPALEEVLRKMMARKPEDRYQTPQEVAAALGRFVAPIALAIPAAIAPLGKVPQAMPVSPGAIPQNVPMAQPMPAAVPQATLAAAESPANDPSFLGMTATGRDMSTGATASKPVAPKSTFPVKLLVILGGGTVLLSLVSCICLFGLFFRAPPVEKKVGVIRIEKAKWSMGDGKAIPGRHHNVLVWIERVDCKGPIKVTLKDLPPGVTADERVFPPNILSDQVRFTVSYDTEPLTKQVKVYAECETDGAKAEFPLTLTVKEDPLKMKK